MPKRYVTLTTDAGDLRLRVSFNVAADFEEETGIQIYGGDQEWFRTPAMLRRFVFLATRDHHADLTEEQIGDMLSGQSFADIGRVVAEAVVGDAAKDGKGKGGSGKRQASAT